MSAQTRRQPWGTQVIKQIKYNGIGGNSQMKKFELTTESIETASGEKLFRIKALVSFDAVEAGELGGYVEKEENLSHEGNAWVYDNARVYGNAWVYDNAQVYGNAWVYGNARVYGNAWVYGNAQVYGNARVYGNAQVCGDADIYDNSQKSSVDGFGSENRTTTFFREKSGGVGVKCGCFYGTLDEFREKVRKTHGDSEIAQEYLAIADVEERRFKRVAKKGDSRCI